MSESIVKTIEADILQKEDSPQLLAMIYTSGFDDVSFGFSPSEGAAADAGDFSSIALVLVLSFVAVVTISRRSPAAQ